MAGELKHSDVGPELTYDEYHSTTSHTIDGVDAGTVIAGKVTLAEVKADTDIADAISKKHSNALDHANTLDHAQGTDQGLDTGGANAVTAAEAKAGYTHSGVAHAPSDAVSLSTVKADTDIASAISLKHSNSPDHTQGTDQGLDSGGVNAVTAAEVKGAVTNSHAPGSDNQTIPDQLSDLSDDATHRLVTDTEKSTWNGKTDLTTVKADTDIASAISLKHAAVTLGTANGLSLSTQELSLAAATSGNAGAATATQISKLDGIEALADVTDATNVAAAGAVMEDDTTTASMSFVIDEDDMASNLDTKVPTQQSVKAYVDAQSGGSGGVDLVNNLKPVINGDVNKLDIFTKSGGSTPDNTHFFTVAIPDGNGYTARTRKAQYLSGTSQIVMADAANYWSKGSLDAEIKTAWLYAIWDGTGIVWALAGYSGFTMVPTTTTATDDDYFLLEAGSTYSRSNSHYCVAVAKIRYQYDTTDTPDHTIQATVENAPQVIWNAKSDYGYSKLLASPVTSESIINDYSALSLVVKQSGYYILNSWVGGFGETTYGYMMITLKTGSSTYTDAVIRGQALHYHGGYYYIAIGCGGGAYLNAGDTIHLGIQVNAGGDTRYIYADGKTGFTFQRID